jgi:hypothetical protein
MNHTQAALLALMAGMSGGVPFFEEVPKPKLFRRKDVLTGAFVGAGRGGDTDKQRKETHEQTRLRRKRERQARKKAR